MSSSSPVKGMSQAIVEEEEDISAFADDAPMMSQGTMGQFFGGG